MAIFKDVVVNIQRLTTALQVPSHGLCLILTTASTNAYKEYPDLPSVVVDFSSSTKAYGMASAVFAQEPKVEKVAIAGVEFVEDFSEVIDGLNLIQNANSGFTFLVTDVMEEDHILQIANWATANKVFYIAVVPPEQIETISNPESDYVVFMIHDKKSVVEGIPQYADAALVGKCSMFQPGSATWMFKSLNGISPVQYDDQAVTIGLINDKKYMTYVSKHGINMTTGGYCTSGEFVDIMLGVMWMQADMELRIQRLLVTTPKVPYDNGGIALIAAQVDATLRQATAYSIIRQNEGGLGEYTINIPDVSDVNPNDIANRIFKDITWQAYLAGAIHHVVINGVVQY